LPAAATAAGSGTSIGMLAVTVSSRAMTASLLSSIVLQMLSRPSSTHYIHAQVTKQVRRQNKEAWSARSMPHLRFADW
jgi:hypothetical protein